jgi:rhombotail lipoprotein
MRYGYVSCALVALMGLTACADVFHLPQRRAEVRNSSSLVEFLYPDGHTPPPRDAIPELSLPLRVGLAFLPSSNALGGIDAAHREALAERIRAHFLDRRFVADITVIPDYYLGARRGFEGLRGVQRLYGVDVMALVSYDQVTHEDQNVWSIAYMTILGAYVVKGERHDISTLVDLAVVDPRTQSLVLRAGGTNNRHGAAAPIDAARETRIASGGGFDTATDEMLRHFDAALVRFEQEIRAGHAQVRIAQRPGASPTSGGGAIGAWDVVVLAALLVMSATRRALRRNSGRARGRPTTRIGYDSPSCESSCVASCEPQCRLPLPHG